MSRKWYQDKDKCEKCGRFVEICTLVTTEGLEKDEAVGYIGSICESCWSDTSIDWDAWLIQKEHEEACCAFSAQPLHNRETLESYLERYPRHSKALTDLYLELKRDN